MITIGSRRGVWGGWQNAIPALGGELYIYFVGFSVLFYNLIGYKLKNSYWEV